jgi:hypothetical protein
MPREKRQASAKQGAYTRVINAIFQRHHKPGANRFTFRRSELADAVERLGLELKGDAEIVAKNLGDIVYSFRFRRDFPPEINATAPPGKMWIITGKGDAVYEFRLITIPTLSADPNWFVTKLHDATPEIVRRFNLGDEQAVLARIRYNRLVDVFCRCVAHSLQNHLRTKVQGIGQIEVDELYVGANRQGEHFIIPVQAKRKKERLGVSQLMQDLEYCRECHPDFRPRPLGAQLMKHREAGKTYDKIVIFEFGCRDEPDDVIIRKIEERHFVLLPHPDITAVDFREAAERSEDEDVNIALR